MKTEGSNKVLNVLIFVSFVYWMTYLSNPFFPLYAVEEFSVSVLTLGLIMSITSATSLILRIPLGMVADRIDRWVMLAISLSINTLVNLLYFLAPSYFWLYLIGILSAVPRSSFIPTANAVASNLVSSSHQRGRIMGRYMTSISLGLFLGPFLGGLLIESLNYRQIFLVSALFSFSGLVTSLLIGSHTRRNAYEKIQRERRNVKLSLGRIVKSRNLIALYISMAMNFFTMGVFYTLFSVYAKNALLLSASFISFLSALRGLTDTLTRFPAGSISDHIGRKRPLIFGLSLMAVAFLCFSISSHITVIFGCIIFGVAFGFRTVTMSALTGDSAPLEDVGLAMALLYLTSDVGTSLGSIFAGAASMLIPITLVFKIAALMLLITTPILLVIKEKSPHNYI